MEMGRLQRMRVHGYGNRDKQIESLKRKKQRHRSDIGGEVGKGKAAINGRERRGRAYSEF